MRSNCVIRAVSAVLIALPMLAPLLHGAIAHAIPPDAGALGIERGSDADALAGAAEPCTLCLAVRSLRDTGAVFDGCLPRAFTGRLESIAFPDLGPGPASVLARLEPRAPPLSIV